MDKASKSFWLKKYDNEMVQIIDLSDNVSSRTENAPSAGYKEAKT